MFSFFFISSDEGLLSLVNARDFRDFLSGLISNGVLTSGELTRTSFAFLQDELAFSAVGSVRFVLFIGVPLIAEKVAAFQA